jgi:ribonuclease P protein component
MMLAAEFRIKERGVIELVKSKGKLYQSENFGVGILQKPENDFPKFAFVISTKISKLAVHRNRINRSLQEGIRSSLAVIPKNYYFVFLAKKTIDNKSTEQIIKEVSGFFNTLKITNGKTGN